MHLGEAGELGQLVAEGVLGAGAGHGGARRLRRDEAVQREVLQVRQVDRGEVLRRRARAREDHGFGLGVHRQALQELPGVAGARRIQLERTLSEERGGLRLH